MSSLYELDPDLHTGSGFPIQGTSGELLPNRRLVYIGNDGLWYLADANVAAAMPTMGITMDAIPTGQRGRILTWGFVGLSTWNWIGGAAIYASTTAGRLSQTAPTAIGNIVQRVGVAITSTMIQFDPKLDTTEAAMDVKTKQYYVAQDDDALSNVPGKSITNTQVAYIGVHFPEDFDTLIGFNIYVIPQSTQGAANWDIATTYGGEGEAYNTHGESDNTTTYNVTNLQWFELDAFALGMFADAEAEDTGGISVTVSTAGHNLTVVMAELYYV